MAPPPLGTKPYHALDDLHVLLSDKEADRSHIDPSELRAALLERIDDSLDDIEVMAHQIAMDSRIVADLFWDEAKEQFELKNPGNLGVRVRINNGSLEVAYFRNGFTRKGESKNKGGKTFYSTHIRRSGKFRYARRDFGLAESWERDLAIEHEKEHERNRKLFAELSKARRYMRSLRKKVIEMDDDLDDESV